MISIEKKYVRTFFPPVLFIGAAFLAGSKRLIQYFPNASAKGLFCATGLGNTAVIGSGLAFSEEPSAQNSRRISIVIGLALSAILAPSIAKKLTGHTDLNLRASFRFVFIESIIIVGLEGTVSLIKTDVPDTSRPKVHEAQQVIPKPIVEINKFAFSKDHLAVVFEYLDRSDIISATRTCKNFQAAVNTPKVQKILVERFAFGPNDWNRYFGDVGEVPPLPHNIVNILKSPCLYWTEKKVWETHVLVLIPQAINGEPLTLNILQKLINNPKGGGHGATYKRYNTDIQKKQGNHSVVESHWILLTKSVICDSREKTFGQQKDLLIKKNYTVPNILEATTAILMHHVKNGEKLYPARPDTYTRCQEQVQVSDKKYCMLVGGFGSSGPSIRIGHVGDFQSKSDGLGLSRKFS